ncbi:MAG: hypothetical protein SFZ02_19195 [bacterium]|nr:hypothetical protein [bacterium]
MEPEDNGLDAQQNGDDEIDLSTVDPRVKAVITKARREAAEWRTKLRALEKKASDAEQAQLKEQGKWREVAEQNEREALRLKPFEEGYTQITAQISEGNQKILATLPEHVRKAAPTDYPPEKLRVWLDTIAPILTKPPAPDLNQGAGGSGGSQQQIPQLSEDEKRIAKAFGLSEEDYAKNK